MLNAVHSHTKGRRGGLIYQEDLGVFSALRLDEDHLLAGHQPPRAALATLKRATRPGDMVDPGLERRGNAEIDHGYRDHHDVGCHEFVDQNVGLRELLALRRVESIGGSEHAGHEILVDVPKLDLWRDRARSRWRADARGGVLRERAPPPGSNGRRRRAGCW